MADKKISQLTALSAANLAPSTDVLAIVDTSATETKKIAAQDIVNGVLNVASAVGIGTASPEALLTVSKQSSGGEGGYIYIDNPAASALNNKAGIKFGTSSGASFASVPTGEIANVVTTAGDGASALTFSTFDGTSSGTRMTLSAVGNLGLGVTPSAWSIRALQVGSGFAAWSSGGTNARIFANTYYDGAYKYVGNGRATQYEQDGYHAWYIAANNTSGAGAPIPTFTQAMTLDASGNLGVGTTSPGNFSGTVKLVVGSAATTTTAGAVTVYSGTATYGGLYFADGTVGDQLYRGAVEYNHSTDALLLYSAGAERARITSGGDLLVGTTTSGGSLTNTARTTVGISTTYNGTTSVLHNTATTIFTAPTDNGAAYLLTATIIGPDLSTNYTCVGILRTSSTGQDPAYTALTTATLASVTLSGALVQFTQQSGVTQTAKWSILRIG